MPMPGLCTPDMGWPVESRAILLPLPGKLDANSSKVPMPSRSDTSASEAPARASLSAVKNAAASIIAAAMSAAMPLWARKLASSVGLAFLSSLIFHDLELVAYAPYGCYVAHAVAGFELRPYPVNVHFQGMVVEYGLLAPCLLVQPRPRDHLPGHSRGAPPARRTPSP